MQPQHHPAPHQAEPIQPWQGSRPAPRRRLWPALALLALGALIAVALAWPGDHPVTRLAMQLAAPAIAEERLGLRLDPQHQVVLQDYFAGRDLWLLVISQAGSEPPKRDSLDLWLRPTCNLPVAECYELRHHKAFGSFSGPVRP